MLKQFKATAVRNYFWLSENEKSTLSFTRLKKVHGYDKKELLKKGIDINDVKYEGWCTKPNQIVLNHHH